MKSTTPGSVGAWRPLLDGDIARQAAGAAHDICAVLQTARLPSGGVSDGDAGMAVLFDYEARAGGDSRAFGAEVDRRLDAAATAAAEQPLGHGLFAGFPGIGWVFELLGVGDEGEELDRALLDMLAVRPWPADYDLIGGLVGHGLYFLSRLSHESGVTGARTVLAHLDALSVARDVGRSWHTRAELLPPWQRQRCPDGYYNLGLAHGVPGVIALLARILEAGIEVDRTASLLEDAVAWLWSERVDGADASFRSWAAEGYDDALARSAWCYGDPGVACALLSAARATGNSTWEEWARSLALGVAERADDRCAVEDAALCHGASGLGHVLNRLWQATGEPALAESARAWFSRALELRRPGEGIAGYLAYKGRSGGWHPTEGLLEGAAGVALALRAATTHIEPTWDRLLLVDVPPLDSPD